VLHAKFQISFAEGCQGCRGFAVDLGMMVPNQERVRLKKVEFVIVKRLILCIEEISALHAWDIKYRAVLANESRYFL